MGDAISWNGMAQTKLFKKNSPNLIEAEEEWVEGGDGVEHDPVDPARQQTRQRRDSAGRHDVLVEML